MDKLYVFLIVAALSLVRLIHAPTAHAQDRQSIPALNIEQTLSAMAEVFRYKIQDDYLLNVQINIQPALESGYVDENKFPPHFLHWFQLFRISIITR